MMGIDERIFFLCLGGLIGFILGYIVGKLRDIKEELDEIKVELQPPTRDERGFMKLPSAKDVALFLVVAMTCYAAVMSQIAANKSNDTADSIVALQADEKQNLDCTTQVLFDAIRALNERTTYTGAQTDANIDLVQGQLDLLTRVLNNPDLTQAQAQVLFQAYVDQVQSFIDYATKTRQQQNLFPYPTVDDLTNCLTTSSGDKTEKGSQ